MSGGVGQRGPTPVDSARMRRLLLPTLAFTLLSALACGGAGDVATPEPPPVEPAAPTLWEVVPDADVTPVSTAPFATVKAGSGAGLTLDQTVTLVGPAPAAGGAQPVVGSARVTDVGTDSAKLVPLRLADPLPASLAARTLQPEDQDALTTLPAVPATAPGNKKAATAAPAEPTATAPVGVAEARVPEDLRTGTTKQRIDALVRYETRQDATAAIEWVMKNDPDDEVRQKAWRVLRARWKRGTGDSAEHEAAAIWAAAQGARSTRTEAIAALGERGRSLASLTAHLDDRDPDIRIAAAKAIAEWGPRAGEKAAAKKALKAQKDQETDEGVRKKIGDLLEDL